MGVEFKKNLRVFADVTGKITQRVAPGVDRPHHFVHPVRQFARQGADLVELRARR
jgi:hypothetical protein